MRAPLLISVVVALHVLAVGAIMFIQGCGTKQPAVEPPPAPIMPPKQEVMGTPAPQPRPVFQPPGPVEHAPSMAEPVGAKSYVVQKGDSLSKIAARVGVSGREIMELNGIKDANKIRIGQKLVLPDYAKAEPQAAAPAAAPKQVVRATATPAPKQPAAPVKPAKETKPAKAGAETTYVVQSGDSLSKVAAKHGVSVAALREANALKSDKIMVGQKLTIPGAKSGKTGAVRKEDAPASRSTADSESKSGASSVSPPATPPVEPELAVAPGPAAPLPAAVQDTPLDYTVQDGDTLDKIAKMYVVSKEEILKLNGWTSEPVLRPGQKMKIPLSKTF